MKACMARRKSGLGAVVTVAIFTAGAGAASAQVVWGTYEQPLEGRRFETMRALSHYLDEAAQDALAGVVQARRRGTPADRRYITAVRDFARRAENFHTRMDDYEYSAFDIPDEVDYLTARARRVNQLVRQVAAYQGTYDDWSSVVEVLSRMRKLLNGEDVEVPPAHDEYGDYDRDYGYLGGGSVSTGGGNALSGARLQQFRDLARELDAQSSRALEAAERTASRYGRAQAVLTDLRGFVQRARDLRTRVDGTNRVVTRDMAPLVEELAQDARALDRRMRDSRVFPDSWDEWSGVIAGLDRMAVIVR
jgi:hypothetical protein